jgi:dihydroneopterin aldolase
MKDRAQQGPRGGPRSEPQAGEVRREEDVILLEGIQVPAALGVTAAERRMRRPVTLDLEVTRDLRAAGRSDSIRSTIHYQRIFEVVEDVASNQEHKLVEALAARIAAAVLDKFDAERVRVTVRKPKPIAGVLEYAGVRITRSRGDLA